MASGQREAGAPTVERAGPEFPALVTKIVPREGVRKQKGEEKGEKEKEKEKRK